MELCLMAVGDVLTHLEIVKAAGGNDFKMLFENMETVFQEADILIGNQETVLTDRVKPSGFPKFATPTGVGKAEEDAGFDLLTIATNHTLDQGKDGLEDAVRFWTGRRTASAIGIRKKSGGNEFSSETPYVLLEREGVKLAFLNYTDPTNLHVNPLKGEYYVPLLRARGRTAIKEEIRKAGEAADFVVVCVHWGIEYLYEPVKSQREWAQFIADAGADLIIGTHPHVVQPLSSVRSADGRSVPVYYSLGNFISCQCFPGTMLGGLAKAVLRLENGEKSVSCEILPLIAHAAPDKSRFTVYPLERYTEELARENRITADIAAEFGGEISCRSVRELFEAIQAGTALADAKFKKPADVRLYNVGRILKLLKKHAPH